MAPNVNNTDSSTIADKAFGELYIAVREKEGRVYKDKQVANLPDIDHDHTYYKEWKMRKRSAGRLVKFLQKMPGPINILEVGCGNGWLSSKLAEIPNAKVTGLDPNLNEIEQASRVFKNSNLKFIYGSFSLTTFQEEEKFNIVLFAASLQYFASIKEVIGTAFKLLSPLGRVHVIDTHFYEEENAEKAKIKSARYYINLGFPQMTAYYFHHQLQQISRFKHKIMFHPTNLWNRISGQGVFYWIRLKP